MTIDTDAQETQNETMGTVYGEAELEILSRFLQETCSSLLSLNKDLLNRELHLPTAVELLKAFAQDKGSRALVVAKIEKNGDQNQQKQEGTDSDSANRSSMTLDANVELFIGSKVEYLGSNA